VQKKNQVQKVPVRLVVLESGPKSIFVGLGLGLKIFNMSYYQNIAQRLQRRDSLSVSPHMTISLLHSETSIGYLYNIGSITNCVF